MLVGMAVGKGVAVKNGSDVDVGTSSIDVGGTITGGSCAVSTRLVGGISGVTPTCPNDVPVGKSVRVGNRAPVVPVPARVGVCAAEGGPPRLQARPAISKVSRASAIP